MSRPTLASLAAQLGVSKMTISRVLNNQPGMSAELRARIKNLIEETGYVPSAAAISLARGSSNLIGMLVPDVFSEWTGRLLMGVGEAANTLGYQVLLRTTGRGIAVDNHTPNSIIESNLVDGLIVSSWLVPISFSEKLYSNGTPLVVVDGTQRSDRVPWVSTNFVESTRQAVEYLASLGHRRIGFIGGGMEAFVPQEQLIGFRAGLETVGLSLVEDWVRHGDYTLAEGYRCAQEILTQTERPTAIVAANAPTGVGVMQVAHELGLAIPEDLSVIGLDDSLGMTTTPPMTTMQRGYHRIGYTAMQLLADQLAGSATEVVHLDLPSQLVERGSVVRPKVKKHR